MKRIVRLVLLLATMLVAGAANALVPPTITISPSTSEPWYLGEDLRYEATFSGPNGVPTGFPEFRTTQSGTFCQPEIDTMGKAACTFFIGSGTFNFQIVYHGDANYAPTTVSWTQVRINKFEVAATLQAAPATVLPGQPVTLTATAFQTVDGFHLNGNFQFRSGGVTIPGCASVPTVSDVATCTATLPFGRHAVTAYFPAIDAIVTDATSPPVQVSVGVEPTLTVFKFFRPDDIAEIGANWGYSMQVTGPSGFGSGTATFVRDGVTACANVPLGSQGQAVCVFPSLSDRGTTSTVIHYSGNSTYLPKTAGPFIHTTIGVQVSTDLVASANPVAPGTPVTFTASMREVTFDQPIFDQSDVTFTAGGVPIPGCEHVPPVNAASQCTVTLPPGTHAIVATFNQNAILDSASDSLQLVVGAPTAAYPGIDFNGNGKADVLWQNTDGRAAIWLMEGLAPAATKEIIGAGTGWSVKLVADFNGDGKADLGWQHADGRIAIYLMDGTNATATAQILNAGAWSITHTPDLDGDGKADLLFRNADGTVAAWTLNGIAMTGGVTLFGAGSGWTVLHTGDFDGDGKDDLLWRHTDGRHAIWLMNGLAVKSTAQILNAGGWTAIHAADLDGDGKADVVWQHADGTLAAWLMNGTAFVSGTTILGAGSGWNITHVGDFNGDGKKDLFFLHADGRAAIWLMNGLTATTTTQILNAGGGWSARRIQDLDGDGKADIVWQNTNGTIAVWLMNGTGFVAGATLLGAGTGWSVSNVSAGP